MTDLDPCWPLFGLALTTPRLELRPIRDGDIPAAAQAALTGIHAPGRSPFSTRRRAPPCAFDWLGAEVAESEAAAWNRQSLGVTRSLGYELNGVTRASWGGIAEEVQKVRLTPETFKRPDWTLQVQGHDATAKYLGI